MVRDPPRKVQARSALKFTRQIDLGTRWSPVGVREAIAEAYFGRRSPATRRGGIEVLCEAQCECALDR